MNGRTASLRAFAGRFVIALFVGSLMMAGVVAGVNREVGVKLDRIPKIKLTTAPLPPEGANYLVVGSDTRAFATDPLDIDAFGDQQTNQGQRSDTLMVVHVEPRAERTLIVSFPRDLWVHIPGHGDAKINAAYNYGPQTIIDTLKYNFDVDVNYYVELNFQSFVGMVNSLGKVPVYVPYAAKDDFTGLDIANGGCWPLDGEQSLQWVRSRSLQYQDPATKRWVYADIVPDIGRIGRQQDFIRRLAGIAIQKSLANPFLANVVADQIVKNLKVDDSFDKDSVFALIDAFRTINPDDQSALEFQTMPWKTGPNQGQQQVLYANMDLAGPLLQRLRTFNTKPPAQPAPATIRVRVVNATSRPDLATAVTQRLHELGFQTAEPVDNTAERIPGVEVRTSSDQLAKGKLLLRYIDPSAQLTVVPASDVDVTLVLGKVFDSIQVPADQAQVTEPTQAATPGPSDTTDVTDAPLELPPPPPSVVLPDPAPRGSC